jgi:hypothetical protein
MIEITYRRFTVTLVSESNGSRTTRDYYTAMAGGTFVVGVGDSAEDAAKDFLRRIYGRDS